MSELHDKICIFRKVSLAYSMANKLEKFESSKSFHLFEYLFQVGSSVAFKTFHVIDGSERLT